MRRITIAARRSVVKAVAVAETDSNPPRGRFRNGTKPAGRQIDFNPRTARSCCRIDPAKRAGSPEQQKRPSIGTVATGERRGKASHPGGRLKTAATCGRSGGKADAVVLCPNMHAHVKRSLPIISPQNLSFNICSTQVLDGSLDANSSHVALPLSNSSITCLFRSSLPPCNSSSNF